jgi:ATP adenylyltransferase
MDRLLAPWRSQYISAFSDEDQGTACVFCDARDAGDDDAKYVVQRHEHCFTMLNLYPYNSGHLLIIPNEHTGSYDELPDGAYDEMFRLVRTWLRALDAAIHPQGYNFGSNIGRTGGAGIDQHVHIHIVPRWTGDANFMPTIGNTKVISEDLHTTMMKLRQAFDTLTTTS